jgi:hypothetical protein
MYGAVIPLRGAGERLMLLPCPGWFDRDSPAAGSGPKMREDLCRLIAMEASMLVTLLADEELARLGATDIGALCSDFHLA